MIDFSTLCLMLAFAAGRTVACRRRAPGPAPDELFFSTFEGVGPMRGSVDTIGIVVPRTDGLPVLLQEDNDVYYLAKCQRLDCATGVTRTEFAPAENGTRLGAGRQRRAAGCLLRPRPQRDCGWRCVTTRCATLGPRKR